MKINIWVFEYYYLNIDYFLCEQANTKSIEIIIMIMMTILAITTGIIGDRVN